MTTATLRSTFLALALATPVFFAAGDPAHAQSPAHPPVLDEVSLTLTEEGWVETDTARVVIRLEAVAEESDAASLRGDFLQVLESLYTADPDDGTDDIGSWRFLSYDRRQDETGLERWTARAEARLPEVALDGLAGEARDASRPGLAVRIDQTDFSPTVADREAAVANLRERLYRRAGEEIATLNAAFPDRDFRLAAIDFDVGDSRPVPMARAPYALMTAEADTRVDAPEPVAVAERVTIRARVRLSAFAIAGNQAD